MHRTLWNERGTALMVAVVGMLIMGVLALSFSLLANVETTIGVNFKQQAQAEALAEAGLAASVNTIRSAGTLLDYSTWLDGTDNPGSVAHALTGSGGESLGPGTYWARIDNDCHTAITGFPQALNEKAGCDNAVDSNEKAIVTVWAQVDRGRARLRAMMGKDDPWKRVCSNSENDPGGPYCTDAANTKGNPSVVPANPAELNGPKGYADLPRPIIGCSRIDPTLHGMDFSTCAGITGTSKALFAQPAVGVQTGILAPGYPAYPPVPSAPAPGTSANPYLVLMGEDPAISTKAGVAKTCNDGVDAGGNPVRYFGYFDCALSTYCNPDPPDNHSCPFGPGGTQVLRRGCLRPTDTRVSDTARYVAPIRNSTPGVEVGDVTTPCSETGMVFTGSQTFINNLSTGARPITLYVQHNPATPGVAGIPTVSIGPQDMMLIGTLVAEGAVNSKNKAEICTGGTQGAAPANTCTVAVTGTAYGYPLAMLAYDPKLPYPSTGPPNAPQEFEVDFGSNNTQINGSVYVAGELTFNPMNVNGSSIAFDIDLQSSTSSYRYVELYGTESPPPGFMSSAGIATMILKSFIVCSSYGAETTNGSTGGMCR